MADDSKQARFLEQDLKDPTADNVEVDKKTLMGRKANRGYTVSVGRSQGDVKQFERSENRSHTLPPNSCRRGDFEISESDANKLKQQQEALLGRVRRGSIFLGAATTEQFKDCWTSHVKSHVYGLHTDGQYPADERRLEFFGTPPENYLKEMRYVFSCIKGSKGRGDSTPNQDNFSVTAFNNGWMCYCVMDGHGPNGHFVSTRTVQAFPYYLINSPFFPDEMEDALKEVFELTNKDLLGFALREGFDVQASGSTSVVCLLNPSGTQFWSAWVGDSRLVLGCETEKGLKYETKDHKPECPEEKARIDQAGGEVRQFRYDDDWTINRIFVKGQDYPGLCMSRSFGDECVKAYGVSCVPTVSGPIAIETDKKPFMLLASDGVWEFLDSDWVIKAISKKMPVEGPSKVVHKLCKEARRKWKQEEGDYCDDITSVLIVLGNHDIVGL